MSARKPVPKSSKNRKKKSLPAGTVERLSSYLNCLLQFKENGLKYVSSRELGLCTGINPAEIRRDLIKFGSFGRKGLGYPVDQLIRTIRGLLGTELSRRIALVGAGNLGTAIANFEGLKKHGFEVAVLFDVDKEKIGKKIGSAFVYHVDSLERVVQSLGIKIGIIATPKEVAQEIAERLARAGVKIIVNYTDTMIKQIPGVKIHNTNPVVELLYTLYFLSASSDFSEEES